MQSGMALAEGRRRRGRVLAGLTATWPGLIGTIGLVVLGLLAAAAPWVAPFDPLAQIGLPFDDPSRTHWLGTDELGRDVASRIIHGLRLSLFCALGAASLAGIFGTLIGLVAGYVGGVVDAAAMRAMDVILSVPAILLAIVLVAILGGGIVPLVLAIAVVGVPPFARLTRASVLTVKERQFVEAQRVAGASTPDIVARTILPNVIGPAITQFVIMSSTAILTESGLSFLGLGAAPPHPSLGSMLAAGNENLFVAPLYPVIVGCAIGLLVATFDAFGTGLRRVHGGAHLRGGVVA